MERRRDKGIYTVDLYLKVRLAVSEGMSRRQAAKHFNILRIALKPATDSETKPATCSDFIPASIPI